AYYVWASQPWSAPVRYRWGWEAQSWHRAYGTGFTPYASYTCLDEWLTDYVVSQNLRSAYESSQAEKQAPADGSASDSSDPSQRPDWDQPDNRQPYWEEQAPEKATPAQPKSSKKHDPAPKSPTGSKSQSAASQSAADDPPPPLPGAIKAELNAQINPQLVE